MTKLYGMLAYACGSIAIATLALVIMVGSGQQAWAVVAIEDAVVAVDCTTCTCSVAPCKDDSCSGGDSCRTGCSCGDKTGGGCKCS